MTKFPEGDTAPDLQLKKVIASVEAGALASGYVPRIALEKPPFHPNLWNNVELYLLGSSRGIAILESKDKPELNPNVAMEWGWMRGRAEKFRRSSRRISATGAPIGVGSSNRSSSGTIRRPPSRRP